MWEMQKACHTQSARHSQFGHNVQHVLQAWTGGAWVIGCCSVIPCFLDLALGR